MEMSEEGFEEGREKLYKVIIIGDAGVGKTSFIQRYVRNTYPINYKMTVGVDFMVKVVKHAGGITKLQLWDIAGQERFSHVTRVYYKNAQACIIMFDITNRESFSSVVRWKNDLDAKCYMSDGDPIPCVLLGNKCDLSHARCVEPEEAETLCKDLMFVGWNETSSKNRLRVQQSMDFLLEEMLRRESSILEKEEEDSRSQEEHRHIQLMSSGLSSGGQSTGCFTC